MATKKQPTKKAAKAAPKKTSKTSRGKKPAPKGLTLSDAALDKLGAAILKVVDYDTAKGIYDSPEDPEHASAKRAEIRETARKHIKG